MFETEKCDFSVEVKRENVDFEGNVLEFYPENVVIEKTEPAVSISTNPASAPPETDVYEIVRVKEEPEATSSDDVEGRNIKSFNDSFHNFVCADVEDLVQCYKCRLNYSSSLTRPVVDESDYEKKYWCEKCVEAFKDFLSMRYGSLVYSNHHLCDICQRVFRKKQYLQEHITRMHMNTITDLVQCFKCRSKHSSSYAQLVTDASDNKTKHLCKKCLDKFRNCLSVRDASLVFLKGYFCDICDDIFVNETLKEHMAIAHATSNEGVDLTCSVCQRTYIRLSFFKKHMEMHRRKKERTSFSCVRYSAVLETKRKLANHITRRHVSELPMFPCSQRELTSRNTSYLERHIQISHQPPKSSEDITFPCTSCERVFSSQRFLDVHTKTAHPKRVVRVTEKLFRCKTCKKTFQIRRTLTRHINGKHCITKAKLRCWVCRKFFAGLVALKTHVRMKHGNPTVT